MTARLILQRSIDRSKSSCLQLSVGIAERDDAAFRAPNGDVWLARPDAIERSLARVGGVAAGADYHLLAIDAFHNIKRFHTFAHCGVS